jgi:hypothetical protein
MRLAVLTPAIFPLDDMGCCHTEQGLWSPQKKSCPVSCYDGTISISCRPIQRCNNGGGKFKQWLSYAPNDGFGLFLSDHRSAQIFQSTPPYIMLVPPDFLS